MNNASLWAWAQVRMLADTQYLAYCASILNEPCWLHTSRNSQTGPGSMGTWWQPGLDFIFLKKIDDQKSFCLPLPPPSTLPPVPNAAGYPFTVQLFFLIFFFLFGLRLP